MSIADIFEIQQSYNLHDKFNDQTNWQDAFKIANSFAETSEKHRANRENLDTSAYRVDAMNALNQANAEEQKLAFNTAQAKNQIAGFYKDHAFDSQNNRYLSPEELRRLLSQYPSALNSQATLMLDEQNRNYLTNMAKNLAPVAPMTASTYQSMATGSPFIIDNDGNLMNYQTGNVVGKIADPNLRAYVSAGEAYSGFSGMLKAQQEAEKARQIQENRNNFTLEQITARSKAAQEKQQNWIDYKTAEADWKTASGFIDTVFSNSNDMAENARQISDLVRAYPHLKEQISKAVQLKLSQAQSQP